MCNPVARRCLAAALLLSTCLVSMPGRADLHFHWHDDFNAATQAKVRDWLSESFAALEAHAGALPLPVHVHIHRRAPADEAVPWAQTRRGQPQGVAFYIDPRFGLQAFRRDWTAAHEFSHLILPYLGSRHAWFAEGFASYMQYQVMQAKGVLTAAETERRYRRNIARAQRNYRMHGTSFIEAAPQLRAEGRYPTMYWGGAVYFRRVDAALRERGSSLQDVLRDYLDCCRQNHDTLEHLTRVLDRLAGSPVFSAELERLRHSKGFPQDVALADRQRPSREQ